MKKEKINVLIFIIILILVVFLSYVIFESGITDKLKGDLNKTTSLIKTDNTNQSDYPVIKYVINSSGEKLVNNDVTLTVNTFSKYNIISAEYSFDRKKWHEINLKKIAKDAVFKINFKKTMKKTVYIRTVNEMGYKSYFYKTKVNIDKTKPTLNVIKNKDYVVLRAYDKNGIVSIEYSLDKENWDIQNVEGKDITLRKDDFNYDYIRAVDKVGNISKIRSVK